MIEIRRKSQEEIENDYKNLQFVAALANAPITNTVCPLYLIENNGTRIDLSKLSDEKIVELIYNDLKEFYSDSTNYKEVEREGRHIQGALNLTLSLNEIGYRPSIYVITELAKMQKVFGESLGDMIVPFDVDKHLLTAKKIASFQKESNGDYELLEDDEVLAVLDQMLINQENKKNVRQR